MKHKLTVPIDHTFDESKVLIAARSHGLRVFKVMPNVYTLEADLIDNIFWFAYHLNPHCKK